MKLPRGWQRIKIRPAEIYFDFVRANNPDGRFANFLDAVNHCNDCKKLNLPESEKNDLVEYFGDGIIRVDRNTYPPIVCNFSRNKDSRYFFVPSCSPKNCAMKRSYTILYADDDQEDLKIISEAFEKHTDHLKVAHACNGKEALQLLERMCDNATAPCLIILDINMPTMNGIETLLQIRKVKEYRQIPVVLFSTSSNHLEKSIAESMDAHFITKPARYFEVERIVQQFVSMCLIEEKVK